MEKSSHIESSSSLTLQFEPFINYEGIVCSFFPQSKVVNAACMGVHFTPTNDVYIHAYDETDTKKNLPPGAIFTINFSENFNDYASAALLGWNKGEKEQEIPGESYYSVDPFPILKNAWAAVSCQAIEFGPNLLPPCRQRKKPNIRAKILKSHLIHLPKIFNNRAFNLAIEALVLVTRIPRLEQYSAVYSDALRLYKAIKTRIQEWQDMDRFEFGFKLMDNFLLARNVKAHDLFGDSR